MRRFPEGGLRRRPNARSLPEGPQTRPPMRQVPLHSTRRQRVHDKSASEPGGPATHDIHALQRTGTKLTFLYAFSRPASKRAGFEEGCAKVAE